MINHNAMRAFFFPWAIVATIFKATKVAASSQQRNRNVNKRTHCFVVDYNPFEGLIPRAFSSAKCEQFRAKWIRCMHSEDKLGFAREKIRLTRLISPWEPARRLASPVSRSQFYLLRKRKKLENSIESLMVLVCNHPYFPDTIYREEFRRRGIRPL
jgi:hypothetical protein